MSISRSNSNVDRCSNGLAERDAELDHSAGRRTASRIGALRKPTAEIDAARAAFVASPPSFASVKPSADADRRTDVAQFALLSLRPGSTITFDAAIHHRDVADAQRVLAVTEHAPAVDFRLADECVVEHALPERLRGSNFRSMSNRSCPSRRTLTVLGQFTSTPG